MKYYLYQITNKVNGKIYVGVHKTRNVDDGYMGSGKVIKAAIEKHGAENFHKEILEVFDDAADAFEREKEIVNEEFLARDDVYNLRRGGHGGFDYINSSGLRGGGWSDEARISSHERRKESGFYHSPEWRNKRSKIALETNFGQAFKGRKHTAETKKLIAEKSSKANKGELKFSIWNLLDNQWPG